MAYLRLEDFYRIYSDNFYQLLQFFNSKFRCQMPYSAADAMNPDLGSVVPGQVPGAPGQLGGPGQPGAGAPDGPGSGPQGKDEQIRVG